MSLRTKVSVKIHESGLFWPLIALVALVACFYVYSVNRTVILVAQRDALESQIVASRAAIAELESSYISETTNITLEMAQSMGYGQAVKVVYIPKKSVSVLTDARAIQ